MAQLYNEDVDATAIKGVEVEKANNLQTDSPKKVSKQALASEVLVLTREIKKKHKKRQSGGRTTPDLLDDDLLLQGDNFDLVLSNHSRDMAGFPNYSCLAIMKRGNFPNILFYYEFSGPASIKLENLSSTASISPKNFRETLLAIHKLIAQKAKEEGIDFFTEIDYQNFRVTE